MSKLPVYYPSVNSVRLNSLSLLCLGAMLAAIRPASAQLPLPVQKPLTIKIGAYFPTDSTIKDNTGDVHFLLGADLEVGKKSSLIPLHYGLYADGIFRSSRSYVTHQTVGTTQYDYNVTAGSSAYDIGVFGRYNLSAPLVPVRAYAGLGAGFYSQTVDVGHISYDNFDFEGNHTRNGIGGKAMLGVESRSGLLGEVSYNLFSRADGVSLSGYGVSIGYRL